MAARLKTPVRENPCDPPHVEAGNAPPPHLQPKNLRYPRRHDMTRGGPLRIAGRTGLIVSKVRRGLVRPCPDKGGTPVRGDSIRNALSVMVLRLWSSVSAGHSRTSYPGFSPVNAGLLVRNRVRKVSDACPIVSAGHVSAAPVRTDIVIVGPI